MQILPGHLQSGSIVLNENIPTLSIGRTLVATVLSAPKSGQVLVSMFGRRIMVETTMALHRGQVLNLKVHALSPRIVLKLADSGIEGQSPSLRNLGNALSRLVGSFGDKPIESFLLQEIVRRLPSRPGNDAGQAEIVAALAEQMTQHPEALAFLLIPLVDEESGGSAKVSVERDGDAYVLHFGIDTDRLGSLECTARMDRGVEVEIMTPSEDTADFLNGHLHELEAGLEPFGVRYVRVARTALKDHLLKGVDVLV